jgi:hypothetical protein
LPTNTTSALATLEVDLAVSGETRASRLEGMLPKGLTAGSPAATAAMNAAASRPRPVVVSLVD